MAELGNGLNREFLGQYEQLLAIVQAVLDLDVICAVPVTQLFSPLIPFFGPSLALATPLASLSHDPQQQQKLKVLRMQLVLSVLVANEDRGWDLARSLHLIDPLPPSNSSSSSGSVLSPGSSSSASAVVRDDEQMILNNFIRLLLERFKDERAFSLVSRSQQSNNLGLFSSVQSVSNSSLLTQRAWLCAFLGVW